jgi:Fe-S-cluster-containing dehydrogenase component
MKKISLSIFKEDCVGCHACEVACKQEHHLGVGPRFIRVIEKSPFFIPIYCHHCAQAPCLKSCPVQAIERNDQGIVLIKTEDCIGCRECVGACPFGAMQFSDDLEVATKCDLCYERLKMNQAPACSLVCPTQCITWGDSQALMEKAAGVR